MRTRLEIERAYRSSGRTDDGIEGSDFYRLVNAVDNQEILLETLLDIRELLIKQTSGY